jgi:single-stranded-DNA-specific exonuclease
MREQAEAALVDLALDGAPPAVALYDAGFHEGVVGIVAGRVKDRLHRPTFVFARGADGRLKGSGRSIPGFHLRDALDLVSKRHPGLLLRFGGHAMAAGCTIEETELRALLRRLRAGGARRAGRRHADAHRAHRRPAGGGVVQRRDRGPARRPGLGPGFEAPTFCDEVQVISSAWWPTST